MPVKSASRPLKHVKAQSRSSQRVSLSVGGRERPYSFLSDKRCKVEMPSAAMATRKQKPDCRVGLFPSLSLKMVDVSARTLNAVSTKLAQRNDVGHGFGAMMMSMTTIAITFGVGAAITVIFGLMKKIPRIAGATKSYQKMVHSHVTPQAQSGSQNGQPMMVRMLSTPCLSFPLMIMRGKSSLIRCRHRQRRASFLYYTPR